ncbi:LuxR family transcriptional regulator [Streptomyces sp. NPDC002588]|uniref:LuxR family transcriptional regulator n=1 Tax=Streptomyces sp. NPDC002588 TaxID=3154419 RepID=UPI00331F4F26
MTGPLRERDDTQALLAAEVERARAGAGRLVLLRGATGTGRSAVLEAAAAHAAARGLRVLRARCSPEDFSVPFSAVLQLLGPVPEFTGEVAPGEDDRGSAARLWRLLRSQTTEGPVLMAVDDVDLADDASRRWLLEAARRVDRLPLLIVATERSQYDIDATPAGLTHALSPSLIRTHTLAPLTDDAAAELVRAAFPTARPRWTADCLRAAAGSPLLLHALLDDLAGAPPAPAVPEACAALYPGSYPAAVTWWLDRAGPATTEVARTLAALERADGAETYDSHFRLALLLADACDADPTRVSGWITAMTRLGLLRTDASGTPRYAHPLLRDAVLAGWPVARRQDAYRTVAEAMLRRGDGAEAVARQLLRSTPVGLPWALRVLRDAVTVAVREARPADAVNYLRRAIQEPLPDDLRQRLLTELGSLEYVCADTGAGIPRFTEALDLPAAPRDRVRTAIALGTALAGRGEVRTAVEMLSRLESGLTDQPDLARTLQTASALLSDQDQTVRQEAYRRLTETVELSPELVGASGRALLVRYAATAGAISAEEAMRRLRTLLEEPSDPLAEPFLLGTAAAVAQWADELDEAQRLVERGLAGQQASLLHPMKQALLDTRSDIAAARGQYETLVAQRPASRGGPSNADAHALIALVETSRIQEARRLADAFDLRDTQDSWELNRFLYARGVLRFTEGDVPGALHDFLECGRRQSARAVLSPVITPWRTAAAECRLALGNPREALTLAEEELRLARVWNTPRTMGRALRVLGRAVRGRRGLELGAEAVRILRDSPAQEEFVTSLLAHGFQLTVTGERGRGRDHLREGAEHAERIGSTRLLAYADEALRTAGARRTTPTRTGSTALTASERRIAELAADGRTNIEIAELLHVARRTVETHLTSAYKKLGIRRRGELRGVLEG